LSAREEHEHSPTMNANGRRRARMAAQCIFVA
jgi:hypothetical protein